MPIKKGDRIKVEYEGTLDDGSVFDSSEGKEPLEFKVGSDQIIEGFEKAVMGMEEGEEKEFRVSAAEAYGETNPELMEEVPRDQFPEGELRAGTMLVAKLEDGSEIPATIAGVSDSTVTVDFNHPLAGKALNFKIKILKIE